MRENGCLSEIPWETRNLGIRSFAIDACFINNPDSGLLHETISRKIDEHGDIFIQARTGKAGMLVAPILQRADFYFVETALVPYTVIRKNDALHRFLADKGAFVPARYDLHALEVFQVEKNDDAFYEAIREIAGESFTDDRFHLDLNCSKEIADRRYSYWVEDLLRDAAVDFDILRFSEETIAFMARKENNLLLAGFSRKYANSGLGDFFWLSVLEQMMREGTTQVQTMISTNNIPVLNLYARIGFKFKDPSVTFHYWGGRSGHKPLV
jgi:ribosomal protein S18 acetylase RimI-like enzyme